MKTTTPTSIRRGRPPLPPELKKPKKPYLKKPTGRPSGRKIGYVVKEESKKKQSDSFLGKFQVQTPDGLFDSGALAAKFYNVSENTIGNRCKLGAQQRKEGRIQFTDKGRCPNDCTGYYKVKTVKGNGTKGRPIRTPNGDFPSVNSAARSEGVTPAAIIMKLKHNDSYHYLDEDFIQVLDEEVVVQPIARDIEIIDLRNRNVAI